MGRGKTRDSEDGDGLGEIRKGSRGFLSCTMSSSFVVGWM